MITSFIVQGQSKAKTARPKPGGYPTAARLAVTRNNPRHRLTGSQKKN
jgi:hypothetical protein